MRHEIVVIGAGLAGAEAALAAARAGLRVRLFEMRPGKTTPAHRTGLACELVCSNSLGGCGRTQAKGLLQAELKAAGSAVMAAAERHRVPAGGALAVDREAFAREIDAVLAREERIERVEQEVESVPPAGVAVLASGPLTSEPLARSLQDLVGEELLAFHDAAAPVVLGESIDRGIVYAAGRHDQSPDYLNCPLDEEEYARLVRALRRAHRHEPHLDEDRNYFEACLPIEELARRGFDTPRCGPLRPRGLVDPRTGREPHAAVQLRREDAAGRLYSLVGFQTGLKWGDQREIVHLIPGLERAEIVRYGVMHRNTYLNAPRVLDPFLRLKRAPRILVAGVLAGVEGYLESAATGLLAGLNAARLVQGHDPVLPPKETMLGGLVRYLARALPEGFQPMNANWGLVPPAPGRGPRRRRREAAFERGLAAFRRWLEDSALPVLRASFDREA